MAVGNEMLWEVEVIGSLYAKPIKYPKAVLRIWKHKVNDKQIKTLEVYIVQWTVVKCDTFKYI